MVYEGNVLSSNRKIVVIGSYFLSRRKARITRFVGATFLIEAVLWALVMTMQAAVPGWRLACELGVSCLQQSSLLNLLPDDRRTVLQHDPQAFAALAAYVGQPLVRIALACLVVVRDGLMVLLLLAIGATLRRLGRLGERVLEEALRWFRRGALAALLWSIAQPLTDVVQAVLLLPALPEKAASIPVNLTVAGPALLLAIAAYAIAWALEAGVRAERDLAAFI